VLYVPNLHMSLICVYAYYVGDGTFLEWLECRETRVI